MQAVLNCGNGALLAWRRQGEAHRGRQRRAEGRRRRPELSQVESYVGHRGVYYRPMIGLVPPGLPSDLSEAEAGANFDRYRRAFLRGRQTPFDAAETRRCVERAIEISSTLERLLEDTRDPRTLGSPVSIE